MTLLLALMEHRRLFVTPLAWVLLAAAQLLLGWMFLSELSAYEAVQARLAAAETPLGITDLVIVPALFNTTSVAMLLTPLLTMRSLSADRRDNRLSLLLSAPVNAWQIVYSRFLALSAIMTLYWLMNLAMALSLFLGTELDLPRLFAALLGGLLGQAIFIAIGLWFSSLTRTPAVAAIGSYACLLLWWMLAGPDAGSLTRELALESHVRPLFNGLVSLSDLGWLMLVGLAFLLLTWQQVSCWQQHCPGRQRWLFRLLLAGCVALGGWQLSRLHVEWDLTHDGRNSLNSASRALLRSIDAPLNITAFVGEHDLQARNIEYRLQPFLREQPLIRLDYVDPQRQPALARELGVRNNGELRLSYRGREQWVRQPRTTAISEAISRLVVHDQDWLVALAGHGEAALDDTGPQGLSLLKKALERRGVPTQSLRLDRQPEIADNTGVLLIAGPLSDYLPGELTLIEAYLRRGGNLLWLLDPDPPLRLSTLLNDFGLMLLPGTLVDANAAKLGLDSPAHAVVNRYPRHPVTDVLSRYSLLPAAAALQVASEQSDWQAHPLLQSDRRSWNETGPLRGELSRDPVLFEQNGPLNLGFALTRERHAAEQRVAVIGDSDFARNASLGEGGNLPLALSLIDWLRDHQPETSHAPLPADQLIKMDATEKLLVGGTFLAGLPMALLVTGFAIVAWRRRR